MMTIYSGTLLCVRHRGKCVLLTVTFDPFHSSVGEVLTFYLWGHLGTGRLNNVPKVTQLVIGTVGMRTQTGWLQGPGSSPPCHAAPSVRGLIYFWKWCPLWSPGASHVAEVTPEVSEDRATASRLQSGFPKHVPSCWDGGYTGVGHARALQPCGRQPRVATQHRK